LPGALEQLQHCAPVNPALVTRQNTVQEKELERHTLNTYILDGWIPFYLYPGHWKIVT